MREREKINNTGSDNYGVHRTAAWSQIDELWMTCEEPRPAAWSFHAIGQVRNRAPQIAISIMRPSRHSTNLITALLHPSIPALPALLPSCPPTSLPQTARQMPLPWTGVDTELQARSSCVMILKANAASPLFLEAPGPTKAAASGRQDRTENRIKELRPRHT